MVRQPDTCVPFLLLHLICCIRNWGQTANGMALLAAPPNGTSPFFLDLVCKRFANFLVGLKWGFVNGTVSQSNVTAYTNNIQVCLQVHGMHATWHGLQMQPMSLVVDSGHTQMTTGTARVWLRVPLHTFLARSGRQDIGCADCW